MLLYASQVSNFKNVPWTGCKAADTDFGSSFKPATYPYFLKS